jgi:hypothetical protein
LNFKDRTATDNGDGTLTLTMDVGRIVFVNLIDYNGTPTNVDDDVFLSSDVESLSGPHPDFESDFELFCSVVIAGLT